MFPHQVAEGLLERDFLLLQVYAAKKHLPHRRLQLQMAKVVQYVDKDPNRSFSFYDVIAPPVVEKDDEVEEIGSMFAAVSGGNVVMLKGRKKKVA